MINKKYVTFFCFYESGQPISKAWDGVKIEVLGEDEFCETCTKEVLDQFALQKKQFQNLTITLRKIDALIKSNRKFCSTSCIFHIFTGNLHTHGRTFLVFRIDPCECPNFWMKIFVCFSWA